MMAAVRAAGNGCDVTLVEKNAKPGRKLMITGKGRCNVTNAAASPGELVAAVPVNGRFLYGAFSAFSSQDTISFFESRGVPLKTERGNRVFPDSDKSSDIVDALYAAVRASGARMICADAASIETQNGAVTGVGLKDGVFLPADAVILATGGASYPQTGSTGDGYAMAKALGHTVAELKPSLVPLEAHEGFCTDLQGLSLRNVAISVKDTKKNKEVYSDFGEMLFTHYGVSGPMILSASSHIREMEKYRYEIYIDLKPALTAEQLDKRILRDFSENLNRDLINSLGGLLPRKLIPVTVKLSGIKPTVKVNQLTKEQREKIVSLLKCLKVTVTGFRPIEEAIVTSGGISVTEIDPKTMRSKLIHGLSFAGEIIDVDAYTGGFNLQIAFSTGFVAGENV